MPWVKFKGFFVLGFGFVPVPKPGKQPGIFAVSFNIFRVKFKGVPEVGSCSVDDPLFSRNRLQDSIPGRERKKGEVSAPGCFSRRSCSLYRGIIPQSEPGILPGLRNTCAGPRKRGTLHADRFRPYRTRTPISGARPARAATPADQVSAHPWALFDPVLPVIGYSFHTREKSSWPRFMSATCRLLRPKIRSARCSQPTAP
jgi:hypothetical protein